MIDDGALLSYFFSEWSKNGADTVCEQSIILKKMFNIFLTFFRGNPAFAFLDFLPGSYQDFSGFLDTPARNPSRVLQDHGSLSRKSKIPTRKFRKPRNLPGNPKINFPNFSKISRCSPRFSRIFQHHSGSL